MPVKKDQGKEQNEIWHIAATRSPASLCGVPPIAAKEFYSWAGAFKRSL